MNTIEWSNKARKQLQKINKGNRQAALTIYQHVEKLKLFPECPNVKRLTNHENDYRLRVGDYRVIFDFTDSLKIINIEQVKKRDENTY